MMANSTPAADRQIQLLLDTSRLKNSYANIFELRFSESEMFLSCGISHLEQHGEEGKLVVQMEHRIVMTPASAMRLRAALDEALTTWAAACQRNDGV